MFTDLKDSTAMTSRLGDAQAMSFLRIHNEMVRDAVRAHEGREVKHTGDGFMLSFTSAPRCVECAIAIQRAFAAYNAGSPSQQLQVRIGISAGQPIEESGDLFGSTVQLAARICDHARPETILTTEAVRDLVADLPMNQVGEVTPKGFTEPVGTFEVRWEASP